MSPIFQSLATKAKQHHESLNAAYATYYGGSPIQSTTPSTHRPSMESHKSSSTTARSSSMSKTWQTVKKAAKEHHDGINAAYATYYGGGASPSGSAASSPRESLESVREKEGVQVKMEKGSAWGKVKERVKEHHRSVNAAVGVYYGA